MKRGPSMHDEPLSEQPFPNPQTTPSESGESSEELLARIPFNDDADEPKTWRGVAHSILLDMFRYAKDELPHRRLVSATAYVDDMLRLAKADAEMRTRVEGEKK